MSGEICRIIGTGGIGKGIFFRSRDNAVLGRNESRMAELSEAKDYCKLHIVFHYLGTLLGDKIEILPIGMVGDDAEGLLCRRQMEAAGMHIKHVGISKAKPTMLSICLQYPDKSGCNITADNSACMEVSREYIRLVAKALMPGKGDIVVALPEVPLVSRIELLKQGKAGGAYCVASCGTGEIKEFIQFGGPALCSLMALNQEETAAFAGMKRVTGVEDAKKAAKRILRQYPELSLWLTFGAGGSLLVVSGNRFVYPPLPNIKAENTGGAGDASLAGLLTGFCMGLWPFGNERGAAKLQDAGKLAVLLAGMSVESADSINSGINWETVKKRAADWDDMERKGET